MSRFKVFIISLIILSTHLLAQDCDTAAISKLIRSSKEKLKLDVKLAKPVAFKAYTWSMLCNDSRIQAEAILELSRVYYHLDLHDSTVILIEPFLKLNESKISLYQKSALYHRLSSANSNLLQFNKALEQSLISLKGYQELKLSTEMANIYVNLGNIYQSINNFKYAIENLEKARNLAIPLSNKTTLGNVYNTLGLVYAEHNMLDSASKYLLLSTEIREKINDKTSIVWNYNNLGGVYFLAEDYPKAKKYFFKALTLFTENENYSGQTSVANNLGELYINMGNKDSALYYFSYSRQLYAKTNDPNNLENLYYNLSSYYDKIGDLKTAFKYSDSLIVLKDSLYSHRLNESMAEMQTKYDVENKNLEIAKNKAELNLSEKQNFIKNIIIVCVIVVSLLLAFFIFYYYKQKRIQQELLFKEEINQQKIERTKSVIEAEEKERARIAQDLHDGVGQLLSAAKLNLSSLQSNIVLTKESDKDLVNNAISLVDDSVKEVRNVSHSMMPNSLVKLGLATAIREFITKLSSIPNLKIDLEIVGLDERLPQQTESTLYRIIQEIFTNVIKHSGANQISTQLIKHEKELTIMIEDNGKGFDTSKIKESEGIGLKGIITRVEFLNGTVDFDSQLGKGTTVVIEVPLN